MKLINDHKDEVFLKEKGEYFFKLNKKIKIIIESKEDIKLIFLNENYNEDVEIYLNSSISLYIYELSINSNSKKYIYQNKKNSKINYYHGNINKNKSDIVYKVIVNENNTENNLSIHSLNLSKDKCDIEVINNFKDQIVSNTKQETIIYDINGGINNIKPILLVGSSNITANHSSFIGKFNKDKIHYIMSRGISKKDTYRLLINNFLISKMKLNDEIYHLFQTIIGENCE